MTINEVKEKHEAELMRLPNVIGVGIGKRFGRDVITVLVIRKVPPAELQLHESIPQIIAGYETDVVPIGELTTQ